MKYLRIEILLVIIMMSCSTTQQIFEVQAWVAPYQHNWPALWGIVFGDTAIFSIQVINLGDDLVIDSIVLIEDCYDLNGNLTEGDPYQLSLDKSEVNANTREIVYQDTFPVYLLGSEIDFPQTFKRLIVVYSNGIIECCECSYIIVVAPQGLK